MKLFLKELEKQYHKDTTKTDINHSDHHENSIADKDNTISNTRSNTNDSDMNSNHTIHKLQSIANNRISEISNRKKTISVAVLDSSSPSRTSTIRKSSIKNSSS